MNEKQKMAIRCALLDLIGSLEAKEQNDIHAHDWRGHEMSIEDLENAFPEIVSDIRIEG